MPALKRRPGLTTWICGENVPTGQGKGNRELKLFNTWEEYKAFVDPPQDAAPFAEESTITESTAVAAAPKPPRFKQTLTPGHFPPSEDFHLERCVRIYPHLQDTGGFFVAVLERKAGASASAPDPELDLEDGDEEMQVDAPTTESITPAEAATPTETAGAKRPASTEPDTEAKEAKRLKVDDAPSTSTAKPEARPPKKQKELKDDPTYKESPYTFLREDDPTLTACL